jgi:Ca2+-binding RTX toxin-like protein
MYTVTVAGAHGQTTTLTFDDAANAALATQIAAQIASNIAHHTEIAENSARPAFFHCGDDEGHGTPPPPLNGLRGLWTQASPGSTVLPKGYDDVVSSARDAVIVGSGDPDENVLAGSGNLTFIATGGSGTVVTGGGKDRITIPKSDTGNWDIHTGNGADTIADYGKGHDTIVAGSGHNRISLGGGTYAITSIGTDTITAGAGAVTVDASGSTNRSREIVHGGSGRLDFIGGAGNATIIGGSGSETVEGGSGALYARGGTDGHNLLMAGAGVATLFGGGNGDTLIAGGAASQQLHAGSGNVTLIGGSATGADTFYGGAGKDLITGGHGADTYVGGSGHATVNAVGSSNVFEFIHGASGGTLLVDDLTNASQVHIVLSGYSRHQADKAIADQVSGANSVTITLSDYTKITFENVTHLTTSNFT